LPARAIQRSHALSPETLAQRVGSDQARELTDNFSVSPE
jgi:hypothetical protein